MTEFDVKVDPPKGGNEDPEWIRRGAEIAARLDKVIGVRFCLLSGLVLAGLILGTPHMLVTYHCSYSPCTRERAYSCDYLGIRGWRKALAPEQAGCPPFRLL